MDDVQWRHMRPMSGLDCHTRRCLANENIYCDEDENLWPNPQDEVDDNKEVQ